jgi:hypothetical protein
MEYVTVNLDCAKTFGSICRYTSANRKCKLIFNKETKKIKTTLCSLSSTLSCKQCCLFRNIEHCNKYCNPLNLGGRFKALMVLQKVITENV